MSRQVLLGGVVGFLLTVTLMAVCQQKEPQAVGAGLPPIERVDLRPAQFDQPGGGTPAPVYRAPLKSLPAAARQYNFEGFDAGRR